MGAKWPRPLDQVDRLLGADPDGTAAGALGCYEPRLPDREQVEGVLRERYDERWQEYWGPVGDRLRVLEADGVVALDRERGALVDPESRHPLTEPPEDQP